LRRLRTNGQIILRYCAVFSDPSVML